MIVIGLLALLLAAVAHRSAVRVLKAEYPDAKIGASLAGFLAALVSILGLLALLSARHL
jgi:hypothetical protein